MSDLPKVILYPPVVPEHCTQIIAGFDSLVAAGRLTASYRALDLRLNGLAEKGMFVSVVGGPRISFDLSDSPNRWAQQALNEVDWYFKRMYVDFHLPSSSAARISPLGPNYAVMSSKIGVQGLMRALNWRSQEEAKRVVRATIPIPTFVRSGFRGTEADLSARPGEPNKRVLFLTRAWNPDSSDVANDLNAQEDRRTLNHERASLIRMLRRELREDFTGGFSPDEYSLREFPDVVVDQRLTERPYYINEVKQHSICIATRGLHGSIGWKFGEYLALSRAIVAEKFDCTFPVPIKDGRHYLNYSSPSDCLDRVFRLRGDQEALVRISEENAKLYSTFLNPASLVARSLKTAGVQIEV